MYNFLTPYFHVTVNEMIMRILGNIVVFTKEELAMFLKFSS